MSKYIGLRIRTFLWTKIHNFMSTSDAKSVLVFDYDSVLKQKAM
jgi:hypothetical protein